MGGGGQSRRVRSEAGACMAEQQQPQPSGPSPARPPPTPRGGGPPGPTSSAAGGGRGPGARAAQSTFPASPPGPPERCRQAVHRGPPGGRAVSGVDAPLRRLRSRQHAQTEARKEQAALTARLPPPSPPSPAASPPRPGAAESEGAVGEGAAISSSHASSRHTCRQCPPPAQQRRRARRTAAFSWASSSRCRRSWSAIQRVRSLSSRFFSACSAEGERKRVWSVQPSNLSPHAWGR